MENHKKSTLRLRLRVTARKKGRELIPGECSDRKRRERECPNSVRKLQRREIGGFPRLARGTATGAPEKFRNIQLQEEFDTYDHNVHWFLKLQFLKKRSKIIEIVAAKDVIFALAQSGLCAAFSRTTNKRICFLNISPDEVIRSLFYNKNNDSLITVSVYASDHFSSLKCRTTPIEYIRRNQLDAGYPLFESESLKWPGFVEFDDVNGKVLTYSAQDGTYKVFDLKNYSFLYSICDKDIQEIKISPGIMLLIYQRTQSHVPLKILSIEDGKVLKSFNHLLHRNKKVDFIEQFNEKLLVKQENENLQILDVRNSNLIEVSRTEFMTPSAFIFLYENHLFLTFRNRTVAVWNFRGELVTSFEDHLLWHPDCNTNNIYITSDQDLIISYCKAEDGCDEEGEVPTVGSINMSNILTGKCIAKICPLDPALQITPRKRGDNSRSTIRSTIREALEDVTALFYDEDRNEIYTGNKQGLIHVWSN
ncbi:uncharacterized protein LOC135673080 [Musa acuminata AAA Group]|uniref:(wild Malaysian banana) hypothetical protein n=1 Tax=Musa acuminata subsp. malaccensis TaxID=214687 RepID=A0A804J114_MUSAM|nr:PREDICTED: uncharacterized protein LOC103983984 [Musa acuminata subsp. malaccensis]CAG1837547.1 unnamed protein product [Musa acuminata subsp. malaccensis]